MNSNKKTFDQISALLTEQSNQATKEIDSLPTSSILRMINGEDKRVAHAVEHEIPYIVRAVDFVVESLKGDGRLIYVGAGTSGRLGVLDAAECPPTFGSSPDRIVGIIAGGEAAMFRSQEGAEDRSGRAVADLTALHLDNRDVVCGIAASRRTPYVVSAINYARMVGAKTIYITTNPRTEFDLDVDVAICPEVGPEAIMGSTRMKSGTAQKLVLNMITTTAMIKLGKVFENMMVDLQLTNRKLEERARRIVMLATGVSYEEADRVLAGANGHVKKAIVMINRDVDATTAGKLLQESGGFVRRAMK